MFDQLLKLEALRSRVSVWRALFFGVACLLVVLLTQQDYSKVPGSFSEVLARGYIARVSIEGTIDKNKSREALLSGLKDNKAVKAVIIRVDSPGGTVGDSEVLYQQLRDIGRVKPVVAVLDNVAASGGYMASLAADHIVARYSTITGSIGVLTQYVGISKLAKEWGVTLKTIKSSELKASSSPFEEMTERGEEVVQAVVDDFHHFFVSIVSARRKLSGDRLSAVSDGKIFTGMQALRAGLVDELGGEREALKWLRTGDRGIDDKLPVRDLSYRNKMDAASGLLGMAKTIVGMLYAAGSA